MMLLSNLHILDALFTEVFKSLCEGSTLEFKLSRDPAFQMEREAQVYVKTM